MVIRQRRHWLLVLHQVQLFLRFIGAVDFEQEIGELNARGRASFTAKCHRPPEQPDCGIGITSQSVAVRNLDQNSARPSRGSTQHRSQVS